MVSKEQVVEYVELVSGTVPPSSAKDCAGYLYFISHKLSILYDMLRSDSLYQHKLARDQLLSISESLLINAKHYEGIPVQNKLF